MNKEWEIVEWNQYNLPEGKKKSTCPICSHTRRKKNDPCLSIFWEDERAYCNHCSTTLQIHKMVEKGTLEGSYEWFVEKARQKGVKVWEKTDADLYQMWRKWKNR